MLGCVDDLIDVDGFVLVVFFAQDRIDTLADKPTELLFDRDSRNFGFEATFLAAGADDFVVEEGNVPELSGKAALAVVEFAVHDDTDGQAASEVEVEYVHLVFGFAVGVFGIASGPGVFSSSTRMPMRCSIILAQGLFARSEIAVTASRRGIDASADADTHSEDFRAFHTARIDEMCDIRADFFEALRAILQFEVVKSSSLTILLCRSVMRNDMLSRPILTPAK